MKKLILMVSAASAALCFGAPAFAQSTDAAAPTAVGEVVIYGRGETRQIQAVKAAQIAQVAPGSSPIKVLSQLPGVNYQASDPFGAYEWAVRISVRGFNQNQMGFTLDGVPLGDMSYGNDNGLHISRAISSENIGVSQLSEGTGALGTASSSNLGGTIEFKSRAPADKFGAFVALTGGSYDAQHEFVRVDSGELPGGGTGYLSFSNQRSQKWKGDGIQKQQQINSKFVQPLGPVTLTGFFNYSDRAENDYQDLWLGEIRQLGYRVDNISDNFPLAVAMANAAINHTPFPAPYQNVLLNGSNDSIDAVYFNASGLRKDEIGALRADWDIIDGLSLHLTGYGHHDQGEGTWFTPYRGTPGGAPLSVRTTEYNIGRSGAVGSLEYKIADHDIEGGFWYEHNGFNQARRFYGLNDSGTNRNSLDFQSNPFFTQWYGEFITDTEAFHLQDSWRVMKDLKVNFGFKSLNVDVTGRQTIVVGDPAADLPSGKISSSKGFLPQIGANYLLGSYGEVFGDYAQNMRAFVGANTGTSPFSTTQAGFDKIKNSLKPETSDTFELGYRVGTDSIQATLTGYYVKFHDRLLVVTLGAGIQGNPNALENVGSVTSDGVETSIRWKFAPSWSLTGAYAFDHSVYDDNVAVPGGTPVLTSGKTEVDTPQHIANLNLAYDDGGIFGGVDLHYMSQRYFTYTNDQSVPAQTLVDLDLGYRFQGPGLLKGLEIQANVTNLFDLKYVSTIGTNGFTNSGDNQTLQAGSPREAFITVKKQF